MAERRRAPTATSSFGVGRREGHDSSAFYARFAAPELSPDSAVNEPKLLDQILLGDSRDMHDVADASVALVVTSPPYFAGKDYEADLTKSGVPGSYLDYLQLLEDVFAECVRTMEPGGRIAVNVANLGRRPYRSLAADVITILQDRLRLLLRGEVVWLKARGAGGSCAWGSFRSPANPTLRDLTERVVIASKGRFDRVRKGEATVGAEEFMEATLDLWELPTESARRVGHPAPFSVELPQRLIELYTFRDDLVLDPFMGSGSTAVAAVRTGRHYIGYDTDPDYVEIARERAERADAGELFPPAARRPTERVPEAARRVLAEAGFRDLREGRKPRRGSPTTIDIEASGPDGRRWWFLLSGAFTTGPSGPRRMEEVWRAIARAALLKSLDPSVPVVLLGSALPLKGTPQDSAVRGALGQMLTAAVDLSAADGGVGCLRRLL